PTKQPSWGRSVPCILSTSNCSGVSRFRHSSSLSLRVSTMSSSSYDLIVTPLAARRRSAGHLACHHLYRLPGLPGTAVTGHSEAIADLTSGVHEPRIRQQVADFHPVAVHEPTDDPAGARLAGG